MRFFTIYRRKKMKDPVRTLRIDGIKTTITPKPDDAELAAQALLESRIYGDKTQRKHAQNAKPQQGTAEYYGELSEKIKAAHEADKRAAMRYVSYVEEELKHQPSDISHLTSLEQGLYQHQNAVEREGGDLKQRWQKCLALVIVKQMTAASSEDEDESTNTDDTE